MHEPKKNELQDAEAVMQLIREGNHIRAKMAEVEELVQEGGSPQRMRHYEQQLVGRGSFTPQLRWVQRQLQRVHMSAVPVGETVKFMQDRWTKVGKVGTMSVLENAYKKQKLVNSTVFVLVLV